MVHLLDIPDIQTIAVEHHDATVSLPWPKFELLYNCSWGVYIPDGRVEEEKKEEEEEEEVVVE